MPKRRIVESQPSTPQIRPASSPEARENQMISLAIDLAEQQLRDGTASSQVITHYLKLGSTKEREEIKYLKKQIELMSAKTEAIKSGQRSEEVFEKALAAMKEYKGDTSGDDPVIL